jgi:hypothetical protein
MEGKALIIPRPVNGAVVHIILHTLYNEYDFIDVNLA